MEPKFCLLFNASAPPHLFRVHFFKPCEKDQSSGRDLCDKQGNLISGGLLHYKYFIGVRHSPSSQHRRCVWCMCAMSPPLDLLQKSCILQQCAAITHLNCLPLSRTFMFSILKYNNSQMESLLTIDTSHIRLSQG